MVERRSASAGGTVGLMAIARRAARDESGATAVEYGFIALGIAVAIVAGVAAIGGALDASLLNIAAIGF